MTIVDMAVYENGRRKEDIPLHEALEASKQGALAWIGLFEPTEEEFDSVRREFDLHELAVEDALNAHQRPKLEVYGDTLFIVLRTATYREPDEISFGEIHLFVGDTFVVSVRHGEHGGLHEIRERLEERPDLLRCGVGSVVHAIADKVVDDYGPVITNLDIDITELEAQAFGDEAVKDITRRIYRLKRQTIEFHRATAPLIEPMFRLGEGRYPLIDHSQLRPYFRDVYDHLVRTVQQIDSFRELLTSILEANLTQVSVRQNEQMRQISAWAAIIAVPTLIAGIYGMNFDHMPELHWQYGYPGALALMLILSVGLHRFFRRIDWL
jgi:magnesium transporter